jgi:hypothetical protein
MKGHTHAIDTRQQLHNLLGLTENDIRKAALQYQVFGNTDGLITSREKLHLSIPTVVSEKYDEREKMVFYAELCDALIWTDGEDPFFNRYIRPCSKRLFSATREAEIQSYLELAQSKLKVSRSSDFDGLELMTIASVASHNTIPVTRNRSVAPLTDGHALAQKDIAEIQQWNLWPNITRDLPATVEKGKADL